VWSCVLLTDASADEVTAFSSVTVVPAGDPMTLVDTIGRLGTSHVLIAAPTALTGQLGTALSLANGRWPDVRIARLISPHSPLAILSALALARDATQWPNDGVRLAESLLRHSWSGAWTASVAKLTDPAPTVGQHLRSFLPGGGFLLRQAPSPAVLHRQRADDVPPLDLDRVLLVQVEGVPVHVTQRLSRLDRVVAVRQVGVPGRWQSIYGGRAGQIAIVPADPTGLLGPRTHRCTACGFDQPGPVCPFCRVVGVPLVHLSGQRVAGHVGGQG